MRLLKLNQNFLLRPTLSSPNMKISEWINTSLNLSRTSSVQKSCLDCLSSSWSDCESVNFVWVLTEEFQIWSGEEVCTLHSTTHEQYPIFPSYANILLIRARIQMFRGKASSTHKNQYFMNRGFALPIHLMICSFMFISLHTRAYTDKQHEIMNIKQSMFNEVKKVVVYSPFSLYSSSLGNILNISLFCCIFRRTFCCACSCQWLHLD